MAKDPIMFENMKVKLVKKHFNESARTFICGKDNHLPWERFASIKS